MPALDALCDRGAVARVATTPPGLQPGSEVGIPTLLGARAAERARRPRADRGGRGRRRRSRTARRLARRPPPPRRPPRGDRRGAAASRATSRPRCPDHHVRHLKGHRFLAVGADAAAARRGRLARASTCGTTATALAPVLDRRTVVVAAPGAAAGCGRLLGAHGRQPEGRDRRRRQRPVRPRRAPRSHALRDGARTPSSSMSAAPTRPPTTATSSASARCSRPPTPT